MFRERLKDTMLCPTFPKAGETMLEVFKKSLHIRVFQLFLCKYCITFLNTRDGCCTQTWVTCPRAVHAEKSFSSCCCLSISALYPFCPPTRPLDHHTITLLSHFQHGQAELWNVNPMAVGPGNHLSYCKAPQTEKHGDKTVLHQTCHSHMKNIFLSDQPFGQLHFLILFNKQVV